MDVPVLADQLKLAYISSVQILDMVLKTYQEEWIIGIDGERKSGKSMLSARLDDIYIYIYIIKSCRQHTKLIMDI